LAQPTSAIAIARSHPFLYFAQEVSDPDTVLIPFVDEIVPAVSLEEGIVLIDPPAGLLELVQPKRRARVVIRGYLPAAGESSAARMRAAEDGIPL